MSEQICKYFIRNIDGKLTPSIFSSERDGKEVLSSEQKAGTLISAGFLRLSWTETEDGRVTFYVAYGESLELGVASKPGDSLIVNTFLEEQL